MEKSLSFETSLTAAGQAVKVKTEDALLIEQSNSQGTVSSFVIHSGSVVSEYKNDQLLKLVYKDLTFNSRGSCHPTSGTLEGSLLPKTEDAVATLSFQMIFVDGEAHLRFADGSEREIILQECSLN